MEILVEGHKIDTKEIVKICDVEGSRNVGFEIHLIGLKVISIYEREGYDDYSHTRRCRYDKYEKLKQKVIDKWEKDKTELEIFNL